LFRTVKHDLLGLKDAATLYVAGEPDARHLVYLQAGFPCDHSSFQPLAARLAAECGCLVGVGCMPDFERESPLRPEGYDIDQLLECFAQAVDALKGQSTCDPPAKLTVVVHDWGCMPGFMYANTSCVDKLVAFDVLMAKKADRLYYSLVHLNYQANFAVSFRLSRYSPLLGRLYLTMLFVVLGILRRWLNPVGPKDAGPPEGLLGAVGSCPWQAPDKANGGSVAPTPYRCYPYYYIFKALASEQAESLSRKLSFNASVARQPVCFIYGEEKNTQFHTAWQLEKLRATPGCAVHAVPEAGHWCYKQAPEVCFAAVRSFIESD